MDAGVIIVSAPISSPANMGLLSVESSLLLRCLMEKKDVIIIADGTCVTESLKSVLSVLKFNTVIVDDADSLAAQLSKMGKSGEDAVIIFCMGEERDLEYWLWEVVRPTFLNPVIVIGSQDEALFKKQYPVFAQCALYHAYFPVPFILYSDAPRQPGLLQYICAKMVPVPDPEICSQIYDGFSNEASRVYASLHAVKIKNRRPDAAGLAVIEKILSHAAIFFEKHGCSEGLFCLKEFRKNVKTGEWGAGKRQQLQDGLNILLGHIKKI